MIDIFTKASTGSWFKSDNVQDNRADRLGSE